MTTIVATIVAVIIAAAACKNYLQYNSAKTIRL